jgi:hypothetical protein
MLIKFGVAIFHIPGIGKEGGCRDVPYLLGKLNKTVISHSRNAGFRLKALLEVRIGVLDLPEHPKRTLAVDLFAESDHPKEPGNLRKVFLVRLLGKDFQPECGLGLPLINLMKHLFEFFVHLSPQQ